VPKEKRNLSLYEAQECFLALLIMKVDIELDYDDKQD
jgi:hypothetical protein